MSEHIIYQGDNLEVLKGLESSLSGLVRCIYIDPPYNTKQKFLHYNDRMTSSDWLGMMKERLVAMKPLLREDGTIWISIDDDECHYLKVLCDEVFGRRNFVANVIWQRRMSSPLSKKGFS